jgi:mannose-6-phosphate isomerase-like protein (cupin superfamily)
MQYSNIAQLAKENENFRKVLFTNTYTQVVLMSLKPKEEIGRETHDVDQILYFVAGTARAEVGSDSIDVTAGDLVDVPAGTEHNFTNVGDGDLKLFTVYSPPEHPDGIVHATKAEADSAEQ